MRKMFVLVIAMSMAALLLTACGGDGDTTTDKAAKKATTVAALPGYKVMAITDGGAIKGRVTFSGAVPAKKKVEVTKDINVCGKEPHYDASMLVSDDKGLANVVVKISNISEGKGMDAMGESVELNQLGCAFKPHISIVSAGAELTILNSDGILHNIHTYSEKNTAINVAQPGFKKKMRRSFSEPEIIRIACDVHNWMGGYIVVTDHPYYAITDASGNFELSNVPAGTYTLEYWQETLGKMTIEATVEAGGTAEANVEYATGS